MIKARIAKIQMKFGHQKKNKKNRALRPHVIMIMADDLGWSDVSWNNPKVKTPIILILTIDIEAQRATKRD